MRSKRPAVLVVPAVFALALGLAACSGSDKSKGAAATTPSPTKPAHDLRVNSELEKFVTDEWNHNFSDKANANYQEGVTVAKVTCVPETGTTVSDCAVTSSAGATKRWRYLVTPDGGSAERTEPGD
jgi:hypothetical protein